MGSAEVLGLYRAMQRSARKFTNYNVREYAQRKLRDAFHKNAGLVGEDAAAAIARAKADKQLIERQATVYELFGSKQQSIIDTIHRKA